MDHKIGRVTLRGGRLIKTSRGVISFAAAVGCFALASPTLAATDAPEPLNCTAGTIGPNGSTLPFDGGLCQFEFVNLPTDSYTDSVLVSGDGSSAVVYGSDRFYHWSRLSGATAFDGVGGLGADNAYAARLSLDGRVVVGEYTTGSASRAFRWVIGENAQDLGSLLDGGRSWANGVSGDGSVVAGSTEVEPDLWHAFIWDEAQGMQDLGALEDGGWSFGQDVSGNGLAVVGNARLNGQTRGFHWTDETGMVDLGTLRSDNGGYNYAYFLSDDGTIVSGYTNNDANNARAYLWSAVTETMVDLGTLRADNTGNSTSSALSGDGTVVVGGSDTDGGNSRAFRWKNGVMQDLGNLMGDDSTWSTAVDVSADGSVVVGSSDVTNGMRAFRWDEADGVMRSLGTLQTDGEGYSWANAVSADGSTVVGYSSTDFDNWRAFIWRTEMQDFTNVLTSFPLVASVTEEAIGAVEVGTERVMETACAAEEGQGCLTVGGALDNGGLKDSQETSSTISYGRGLANGLKLGGTLALGEADSDSDALAFGRATRIGVWSTWSATGSREGLSTEAGLGWAQMDATIERGVGLDNVMVATGEAEMSTSSARAAVAYGLRTGGDWLLTSRASVAHFETTRAAYAETGSDFNASYDELTVERTTATIDFTGERAIGKAGTLSLGIGLERDLTADDTVLTGSSTVPGLETMAISGGLERRQTRGVVSVGYAHDLGANRSLGGSIRVEEATFGDKADASMAVGYSVRF